MASTGYTPMPTGNIDMSQRETERRRISSVVLGEELLEQIPEDQIRYVEVPYIEEVVKHVPRKEIVEIEKRVPKYEYEWVEKVVEIPQIQYVDKTVEVPQIQEVIRHVPRKEVVDVPKEVIRHVPKIETKVVEKIVEIPGQVIEVPKPYTVENKVSVPVYHDTEVPMVVAQSIKPIITESNHVTDVDIIEYEPQIVSVDIHVPKPVHSQLLSIGAVAEEHRVVNVPAAQYNSMLKTLNPHIMDTEHLPYLNENGSIPMLNPGEFIHQVSPLPNVEIKGWKSRYVQHGGVTEYSQVSHHQTGGQQVVSRGVARGGVVDGQSGIGVASTSQVAGGYRNVETEKQRQDRIRRERERKKREEQFKDRSTKNKPNYFCF